MAEGEPSYIDYEAFLDPGFSPAGFANSLVLSTNNANDTPLDLSTPLSRVLFDVQEIDTHLHTLTSRAAEPLLTHTRDQTTAAEHILQETGEQIGSVTQGYERLEKEVLRKWEGAEEARVAAANSLATVRLARAVGRCVTLGRQLESQLVEVTGRGGNLAGSPINETPPTISSGRDDFRALERAAYTILNLRRLLSATTTEGEEGYGLGRVKTMRTLRGDLLVPAENTVKARAQQAVQRFSAGAGSTDATAAGGYKQARDARARLVSAITTLYILSPGAGRGGVPVVFEYRPELLLSTLQGYMQTAISSALSTLARGLAMLPTIDRALADVAGKCQDIVALEAILATLKPPTHPLLLPLGDATTIPSPYSHDKTNLLQPLLQLLDTSSLPSYFWRSIASSLTARVQEILNRGGVSARTLRSNRERLKTEIRECVLRGLQVPGTKQAGEGWEREAAVMVGSVSSALRY
ncbi:hypothetical protein ASPZODRAFT_384695 [Penicilliopsis zonata CBS 506.65]|uniref:Conserved oligomeric Golgi complex subunit 5 n=1 Tax=Penicilliopsis zonata CBS 506.65 TaxID=1073090 RepID=A0A1L9SW52_9EURO|nr:hypothetical protein ASPZODRAFT_384695 [Penicilliopsis zonata CBS 506.65]OJJ51435.1 hypothetical protein ASPZODRAFT_384695 [Penicilliopsis zonata CBS 506.65]